MINHIVARLASALFAAAFIYTAAWLFDWSIRDAILAYVLLWVVLWDGRFIQKCMTQFEQARHRRGRA